MEQPRINFIAVVAAAAAMWFAGMAWYMALSAPWMAYTGVTEEMAKQMTGMEMALAYGGSFAAYIVLFYCMAHVMHAFKAVTVSGAVQAGFWSWLGFTATALFVSYTYQGKPFGLVLIDGGYWLVGMVLGSVILAKMPKKEKA